MPHRALVVGIDDYQGSPLLGCCQDANNVAALLEKNGDGSPNFHVRVLTSDTDTIDRQTLRNQIRTLFEGQADIALLFFAGHGAGTDLGGHLVTQDGIIDDEGVPMRDVIELANASAAKERIILLDCCHAGALGNEISSKNKEVVLSEGVSVLTACRDTESAIETSSGGLFTTLLCAALAGGAADVCGKVTIASAYAYADEVLSAWDQRPLFKSHVTNLVQLRRCKPAISLETLREITTYFPTPTYDFPLNPSFEPTEKPKDKTNEAIFTDLQQFRAARLLVPVDEEHLYYAAIRKKSCRLTPLGEFYWNRVKRGKI